MSLPLEGPNTIPADTVRIARSAFPKGTLAMNLRDHRGTLCDDPMNAEVFSPLSVPAIAPRRLAHVSVLQFADGLSDRQADGALRGADGKEC